MLTSALQTNLYALLAFLSYLVLRGVSLRGMTRVIVITAAMLLIAALVIPAISVLFVIHPAGMTKALLGLLPLIMAFVLVSAAAEEVTPRVRSLEIVTLNVITLLLVRQGMAAYVLAPSRLIIPADAAIGEWIHSLVALWPTWLVLATVHRRAIDQRMSIVLMLWFFVATVALLAPVAFSVLTSMSRELPLWWSLLCSYVLIHFGVIVLYILVTFFGRADQTQDRALLLASRFELGALSTGTIVLVGIATYVVARGILRSTALTGEWKYGILLVAAPLLAALAERAFGTQRGQIGYAAPSRPEALGSSLAGITIKAVIALASAGLFYLLTYDFGPMRLIVEDVRSAGTVFELIRIGAGSIAIVVASSGLAPLLAISPLGTQRRGLLAVALVSFWMWQWGYISFPDPPGGADAQEIAMGDGRLYVRSPHAMDRINSLQVLYFEYRDRNGNLNRQALCPPPLNSTFVSHVPVDPWHVECRVRYTDPLGESTKNGFRLCDLRTRKCYPPPERSSEHTWSGLFMPFPEFEATDYCRLEVGDTASIRCGDDSVDLPAGDHARWPHPIRWESTSSTAIWTTRRDGKLVCISTTAIGRFDQEEPRAYPAAIVVLLDQSLSEIEQFRVVFDERGSCDSVFRIESRTIIYTLDDQTAERVGRKVEVLFPANRDGTNI